MGIAVTDILVMIGKAFLTIFIVFTVLASAVATSQEHKIWKPKTLPSMTLYGYLKCFLLNVTWLSFCMIATILLIIKWILMLGKSDIQYEANQWGEYGSAMTVIYLYMTNNVHVDGLEHLPPVDSVPAPVYICNHASQIDAALVYFIQRRFKWIAKNSTRILPGVGQLMSLANHVFIYRTKGKNKKSVSNLFEKSSAAVQGGIPMFFFPQGTRRIAEVLPFKDGAFIVAQDNKSTLVPLSLEIPINIWNNAYPFNFLVGNRKNIPIVKLTIHKPIPVTGKEDRGALKQQCKDVIYSVLPEINGVSAEESNKKGN